MSIECAEQLGFDAAWDGKNMPNEFAEWLKYPQLLAAWYRGYAKYQEWK